MTAIELSKKLLNKAEQAVRYLYKDGGTFRAGRFSIGNIRGEAGDSLVVYLASGRFTDMATGEGGDLLELYSLYYGSKKAGIDAAYGFLGINKPMIKKQKAWTKPEVDWTQLTENPAVEKYLVEDRKLGKDVLKAAKVAARENKFYTFITYTHDPEPVPCGANSIGIKRKIVDGKEKKVISQSNNPLSVLFGHPSCKMGVKNESGKRFVIITEGQIDALSFRTQGILNTVSIPFGAADEGWIENSWDWLKDNFDEIYLCYDNDETGNKKVDKVAKRIGYEKCKQLILPAHYNDPNAAHIDDYDLHKAVDNAVEFKPGKLVEATDLWDEAMMRLARGRRDEQGTPFMGWMGKDSIKFNQRPKEMTIYTGWPGEGKSNLLYQNTSFLVFKADEPTMIASLEEDVEDIIGIIAVHALGLMYDPKDKHLVLAYQKLKEEARKKIFFYHHRNRAPFEEVLNHAEYTIRKYGVKHFIMDSVAKTDLQIEKNEDANKFVGMITSSMNDTGAHYHVVAHAKKGENKNQYTMPGLNDIKGDNAFGVETFNCVSVWRDPLKTQMLTECEQKGHYSKQVWEEAAPVKTGGFTSNKYGQKKIVEIGLDEVMEYRDGIVYVCKQKVGGKQGKYDIFYDPKNDRISRHYPEQMTPYATGIYQQYLEDRDAADSDDF